MSAFTGTEFTTREVNLVVNHPTRRRIISWMMFLGNARIVAVIITTTTSFVDVDIAVCRSTLCSCAPGLPLFRTSRLEPNVAG